MANKVALITGVTGQDGAYLAELLLGKSYEVHGIKRRSSTFNSGRVDHLYRDLHEPDVRFKLHYGDLTDGTSLIRIIQEVRPTEIYNLAAQSHVQVSFETAEYTANADAIGTLRLLEAIRILGLERSVTVLPGLDVGDVRQGPGNSAVGNHAVLSALALRRRQALCLLDHGELSRGLRHSRLERHPVQSREPDPRRNLRHAQDHRGVAAIAHGLQSQLFLGNLDAKRDWGHARDYVEGMWLMLQQEEPDDYVLATGESHTVREFVEGAFAQVGRRIVWRGEGVEEIGMDDKSNQPLVTIDPRYFRPTEVDQLLGNPAKAKRKLGWTHKIGFNQLIAEMMESDLQRAPRARQRYGPE